MSLTAEQVDHYDREGYLIAEGILSDQDFQPVERDLDRLIDQKTNAFQKERQSPLEHGPPISENRHPHRPTLLARGREEGQRQLSLDRRPRNRGSAGIETAG